MMHFPNIYVTVRCRSKSQTKHKLYLHVGHSLFSEDVYGALRLGFDYRSVHVRYAVNKVAL